MAIVFAAACGGGEVPSPPPGALTTSNGQPLKACASNGDCSQPEPYCFGGYCVQCLSSTNCGGRQCGPTHECVECTADSDCGGPLPYCSQTTFQCVQCVGASNCAQGQTCNGAGRCVLACTTDSMCMPFAPYCSPTLGTCVACTSDTNCGGDNPYCNPDGACVQCLTDANCSGRNGGGGGGTCRGFRCR